MNAGKGRDQAERMIIAFFLLSLIVATFVLCGCGDSGKSDKTNGDVIGNGLPVFLNFTSPT